MGDLPLDRLKQCRSFLNSGVDYCGPFTKKVGNVRSKKTMKAYLALFVCFATKAVHIETVSNLTTEAFLAALKRFIARRGKVCNLYSDNGTNFVGANRELKELYLLARSDEHNNRLTTKLANKGINWRFIPARSPYFGLWEAAVKATKHHLKRVAGDANLTFEELTTLSTQIHAILYSRPLSPLSNDIDDLNILTPAHFLIGDSLVAIVEPTMEHIPTNRLSRYQRIQSMRDHFWRRWNKEYLHQLQQRSKWKRKIGVTPQVGDLVIVKEANAPPQHWPLARIVELHPGRVLSVYKQIVELCSVQ